MVPWLVRSCPCLLICVVPGACLPVAHLDNRGAEPFHLGIGAAMRLAYAMTIPDRFEIPTSGHGVGLIGTSLGGLHLHHLGEPLLQHLGTRESLWVGLKVI